MAPFKIVSIQDSIHPSFSFNLSSSSLQLQFRDFANEREHLRLQTNVELDMLEQQIIKLRNTQKWHYGKIAEVLGTNKIKAMRVLDQMGMEMICNCVWGVAVIQIIRKNFDKNY